MKKRNHLIIYLMFMCNIMSNAGDTIYSANRTYALIMNYNESETPTWMVVKNKGLFDQQTIAKHNFSHSDIFNWPYENSKCYITNDGEYIVDERSTIVEYEGVLLYWVIYRIKDGQIKALRTKNRLYSIKIEELINLPIPKDRDRFYKEYKEKYYEPKNHEINCTVLSSINESGISVFAKYFNSLDDCYVEDNILIPFKVLE